MSLKSWIVCSLGLLVKRIETSQIESLISQLGEKVTKSHKAQEKEIYSLALKAVVADLPTDKASNVVTKLAGALAAGLKSTVSFIQI